MERNFSVRLSLVVVATLLVLYLITLLLLNPLPSYGQGTVQYIVVDQITQSALWAHAKQYAKPTKSFKPLRQTRLAFHPLSTYRRFHIQKVLRGFIYLDSPPLRI